MSARDVVVELLVHDMQIMKREIKRIANIDFVALIHDLTEVKRVIINSYFANKEEQKPLCKFAIGDRVIVYNVDRGIDIITEIAYHDSTIKLAENDWVHMKQCRRIKVKSK